MSLKFLCKLNVPGLILQEAEGKTTSWIQIFRKGEWKHPRYGNLKFTDEIFAGFIKNFNDRVRKIDIALDAEHEPERGACAWIKQLEQRGDGLWALAEWTSRGLQLIADGVFRYTSGDFDYVWKDEESGKKYQNVLFGAALTNRPFIKGMSPINLSEFREELEKDENIRNSFQLAEDIIKLKEGDKVKSDAEIMACKVEADLTPEELIRKKEIVKADEAAQVTLARKKLAERAKAAGLAEDAAETDVALAEKKLQDDAAAALKKRAVAVGLPDTATEAEVAAKEKEMSDGKKALAERAKKVKLSETATLAEVLAAEQIGNENEQTAKIAVALGLGADATLDQIYAAASKFVLAVQTKIQGSARTMSDRAKSVGLSETATEVEVVTKEKELSDKKLKDDIDALLASDVPTLEKKLAEMKTKGADALTVKLLEETIAGKKTLHETNVKNAKEKIELKLKEHFKAGKLTAKERDTLKAILCAEAESGETSFKLSEKDKDGKQVEATKTLGEIIDAILNNRPAIVELQEIAKKELSEPPKDANKKLDEEAPAIGARIAGRVTKATKTAKKLAEEKLKEGK